MRIAKKGALSAADFVERVLELRGSLPTRKRSAELLVEQEQVTAEKTLLARVPEAQQDFAAILLQTAEEAAKKVVDARSKGDTRDAGDILDDKQRAEVP